MDTPAAMRTTEAELSWADGLEFIASLADSLGWPIVILIIVVAFRNHVGKLINNITTITVRGSTITVARELDAAKEQAASAGLRIKRVDTTDEPAEGETARILRQVRESSREYPRAAIIEGWLVVERELSETCERLDLATTRGRARGFMAASELLQSAGHLNADLNGLLRHLRHLRNEAAHNLRFDVSPDEAQEYIVLCGEIIDFLQNLSSRD